MPTTDQPGNTAPQKKKVSTSETGHTKNITHFAQLITVCQNLGPTYNPSKPSLTLTGLQAQLTAANDAMSQLFALTASHEDTVNLRRRSFDNLGTLSIRIVNSLQAFNVSKQTIDDAKGYNRKFHGTRSGKLTKADAGIATTTPSPDPLLQPIRNISASQSSFDHKVDHFAHLVALLHTQAAYLPNEPDLRLDALDAHVLEIRGINNTVFEIHSALGGARLQRNQTLYLADPNLVDTANGVKNYVKSVFGPSSPQYKLMSRLAFRKLV